MTARVLPPLKRFGQHFLTDENVIRKILGRMDIDAETDVLEIGPGRGALTFRLAERARSVTAVEIDRGLCRWLESLQVSYPRLSVIEKDILKFDLAGWMRHKDVKSFTVVGNLPYYITTPIVEYLWAFLPWIRDVYVTVQKEVAVRMVAGPGTKDYGAFTCFVNLRARPEILMAVPKSAFWPAPRVDSVFLRLRPYGSGQGYLLTAEQREVVTLIVRTAFGQRRKQLGSSLSSVIEKQALEKICSSEFLKRRPEDVSLDEFVSLGKRVFDNCPNL